MIVAIETILVGGLVFLIGGVLVKKPRHYVWGLSLTTLGVLIGIVGVLARESMVQSVIVALAGVIIAFVGAALFGSELLKRIKPAMGGLALITVGAYMLFTVFGK